MFTQITPSFGRQLVWCLPILASAGSAEVVRDGEVNWAKNATLGNSLARDLDCAPEQINVITRRNVVLRRKAVLYESGQNTGKGAFGEVVKGKLVVTPLGSEVVAIKKSTKPTDGDQSFAALSFATEVRALEDLKHNHIVRMVAAWPADTSKPGFVNRLCRPETDPFDRILLELCTGGDLFKYVQRVKKDRKELARLKVRETLGVYGNLEDVQIPVFSALPEDEALEITIQVANGLAFIHSQGYVHLDLKPANVLLRRTATGTTFVIADFGSAKKIDWTPENDGQAMPSVKDIYGNPPGTFGYLSLEVMLFGQARYASDIFALGYMLYYMIAGKELGHFPEYADKETRFAQIQLDMNQHRLWPMVKDSLPLPANGAMLEIQSLIKEMTANLWNKRPPIPKIIEEATLAKQWVGIEFDPIAGARADRPEAPEKPYLYYHQDDIAALYNSAAPLLEVNEPEDLEVIGALELGAEVIGAELTYEEVERLKTKAPIIIIEEEPLEAKDTQPTPAPPVSSASVSTTPTVVPNSSAATVVKSTTPVVEPTVTDHDDDWTVVDITDAPIKHVGRLAALRYKMKGALAKRF